MKFHEIPKDLGRPNVLQPNFSESTVREETDPRLQQCLHVFLPVMPGNQQTLDGRGGQHLRTAVVVFPDAVGTF